MKLFRILFAIDALGSLVLLYFFVDGLRYGLDGDALSLWVLFLGVPVAVMAGAWVLRGKGNIAAANVLLGVLAVPFLLYGLFVGMFVALDPDMR
jgi:hypothetical protein